MKPDIAAQLEGYQEVLQLAKAAETLGEDFRSEKGVAAAYLARLHPAHLSHAGICFQGAFGAGRHTGRGHTLSALEDAQVMGELTKGVLRHLNP